MNIDVKKTILNQVFYFFDRETANSISKDGRRLMEEIDLKNDVNYPKSEESLALSYSKSIEWLNKNQFEKYYRNSIEKGFALDATDLIIY